VNNLSIISLEFKLVEQYITAHPDNKIIVVDHQEKRSRNHERLSSLGFLVIITTLPVGDYILNGIAIERKTIADFCGSLSDGSLNQQQYELSHNFKYSILAIIGIPSIELVEVNFPRRSFFSATVGVATKRAMDGKQGEILPWHFETEEDFCLILDILWKRSQGTKIRYPGIQKQRFFSKEEVSEAIVALIPGIGNKYAKILMKKFGSVQELSLAGVDEMSKIKGVGKKKAESIYKSLRNL
jgi:ERCC4-type nuclease